MPERQLRIVALDEQETLVWQRFQRVHDDAFPERAGSPVELGPLDHTAVLLDGTDLVGFTVRRRLGTSGWHLLRFLAVATATQSRGLGGVLWRALCDDLAAQGPWRLVLEVDDPAEDGLDAAALRLRQRRIAFYERNGARLLAVSGYHEPVHPPPHTGVGRPMRLMAAVGGGARLDTMTATDRARLVADVQLHRYGLDARHPFVRTYPVDCTS